MAVAVRFRSRTLGAALAAGLLVALGGCGGSSAPSSLSHSITSPTPPPSPPPAGSDKAKVTRVFITFFAGRTPAAQKIALLQNGQAFAKVIEAQANSPIARATGAKVLKVGITPSGTKAKVDYEIVISGKPALEHQLGTAVKENGQWKVAAPTFCALLTMEHNAPQACNGPQ